MRLRLADDGRLKILDFGLAKLRLPAAASAPTEKSFLNSAVRVLKMCPRTTFGTYRWRTPSVSISLRAGTSGCKTSDSGDRLLAIQEVVVRSLNPLITADSDDRNRRFSFHPCETRSQATRNHPSQLARFFATAVATFLLCLPAAAQQKIPSSFFGLQMNSGTVARQPWPSITFSRMRLWDSGVTWQEINTARFRFRRSLACPTPPK